MKKILVISLCFLLLLTTACSITINGPTTVRGSGNIKSETRSVSGFTGVQLSSSADVEISFGDTESVSVEADDNLLPYIRTYVRAGTLVIDTQTLTSISTSSQVRVTIVMKSLEQAAVAGSGNITISDLNAQDVAFNLPGSGKITASGTANGVTITLNGSGDIDCGALQAKSANVKIFGSGNITVNVSDSLNATILGSGNIQYRGNPSNVTKSISGSGNINPVP